MEKNLLAPIQKSIHCNVVNLFEERIFEGIIHIGADGLIAEIEELKSAINAELPYAMPGFVDAHIHIESSLMSPAVFSSMACRYGTVATVSDPHEIANVLGAEGVLWMIENAEKAPLKIYFGAPSCVPATSFETAGATFSLTDIKNLFEQGKVRYLAEMMNFPGVLFQEPEVMAKINLAHQFNMPIDGHAPQLRGEQAKAYFSAGISTDHECSSLEEALEKAALGVKIWIREGSAARNFEALHPIIEKYPDLVGFCSDDKHPDSFLENGHINQLVAKAIALGYPLFDVLKIASKNPVYHYKLSVGLLRQGDNADFILCNDLVHFQATSVFINGEEIVSNSKYLKNIEAQQSINKSIQRKVELEELAFEPPLKLGAETKLIGIIDKQLITQELSFNYQSEEENLLNDVLKLVVCNRYEEGQALAKAFVKGFGLQAAAIASSVAHDSHNFIAVGSSDKLISDALNRLFELGGGLVFISESETLVLPLPIAGLMSDGLNGDEIASAYLALDAASKKAGSKLTSPYMTLSFLALLVIPQLKLSDKGLFSSVPFNFVSLQST